MWKYIVVYWVTLATYNAISMTRYDSDCKCIIEIPQSPTIVSDTSRKEFKYRKDAIRFMKTVQATDSRLDSVKVK